MAQSTSSPADLKATVRGLIAQTLDISRDRVVGSAALAADLGATSLDSTELIMAIEDEFRIDISDDRAAAVVTVGDLERLILHLQEAKFVTA